MTVRFISEVAERVINPKTDPARASLQRTRLGFWSRQRVFPRPWGGLRPAVGRFRTFDDDFLLIAALATDLGETHQHMPTVRKILANMKKALDRWTSKTGGELGNTHWLVVIDVNHDVQVVQAEELLKLLGSGDLAHGFLALDLTAVVHRLHETKIAEDAALEERERLAQEQEARKQEKARKQAEQAVQAAERQGRSRKRRKDPGPVERPFWSTVNASEMAAA